MKNNKEYKSSLFDKHIVYNALIDSFKKMNPRVQLKNPVMFVVYVGSIFTSFLFIEELIAGNFSGFNLQITIWLWFTVLFANFAEAIAEGRGKAQAESLRKLKTNTFARKFENGKESKILSSELKLHDVVICEVNDIIPADGEVIEGIATVDESAITGESAPVIRESGGDRSAVTGGTKVLSDKIFVQITSEQGNTFLDRMIALVEGAKRKKTPNEIALTILLSGLTIIFLLAVVTLYPFAMYAKNASGDTLNLTIPILVSLLVCLIPTTIGGLLSAIGISGMDRLVSHNVIAKSGRAVEASGDIDVLLLDKTGTITLGNRMATEFYPTHGITENHLAEISQLASLSDDTPEGRSIVILAKEKFNIRGRDLSQFQIKHIPFTAQTRMSGIDIFTNEKIETSIRKGAAYSIKDYVISSENEFPQDLEKIVMQVAMEGSTPLVVSENGKAIGVIKLKDIVKGGIKERFEQLRKIGIKTIMITGDNQLTASAIAAEAGVDDYIAEAKPEDKLRKIREEQAEGRLVAMIGDGTNDAPALAQADVGVAMNTGTQAAREAGNMVDLDSNPTKLIEIVEIGKQLLMTRGALTTFSIANDIAKYFAIIPAIFAGLYAFGGATGPLSKLNIMYLQSPESAILSSIIFNAIIIVALIPLALKGVKFRAMSSSAILGRNLLIYGLGGVIAPFVGIKGIDLIINFLHLV
ncbi:MAG TPA: K(+)-transporting ATPase subunit B [Bacteroidales bacterium]|nr:K(+)-transporting ATPase subunit B [Bacteroidales bacterium]